MSYPATPTDRGPSKFLLTSNYSVQLRESRLVLGSLRCLVQFCAGQDRGVTGAGSVDVYVFDLSCEEIIHRSVLERRGARPVSLCIGVNLGEGPLDLLG